MLSEAALRGSGTGCFDAEEGGTPRTQITGVAV